MMNYKNRPVVNLTPEQIAGKCYSDALKVVDVDGRGLEVLAIHVACMLGKNELKQPIWMKREFPDGKIVELEKFEDYLLQEPRIGLKVPSLYNLVANLNTMPDGKGVEALSMLRKAIPDLDAKVKAQSVACHVNKSATLVKNGEVGRGRPKEDSCDYSTPISRGSTSADYLVARIKRDAPEIAERMKCGEFKSVRAAAIEAGIVKQTSNLDSAKRIWLKMNNDERGEFLHWISNEA